MSDEQQADQHTDQGGDVEKPRADAPADDGAGTDAGTGGGDPIAGVRIDPEEAERAAEPDDAAFEVDGPEASTGHA